MINLFLNKDDEIIFAFPSDSKRKRTDVLKYIDAEVNRDNIKIILVEDSKYDLVEDIIQNKKCDKEKLYYKSGSIVKV